MSRSRFSSRSASPSLSWKLFSKALFSASHLKATVLPCRALEPVIDCSMPPSGIWAISMAKLEALPSLSKVRRSSVTLPPSAATISSVTSIVFSVVMSMSICRSMGNGWPFIDMFISSRVWSCLMVQARETLVPALGRKASESPGAMVEQRIGAARAARTRVRVLFMIRVDRRVRSPSAGGVSAAQRDPEPQGPGADAGERRENINFRATLGGRVRGLGGGPERGPQRPGNAAWAKLARRTPAAPEDSARHQRQQGEHDQDEGQRGREGPLGGAAGGAFGVHGRAAGDSLLEASAEARFRGGPIPRNTTSFFEPLECLVARFFPEVGNRCGCGCVCALLEATAAARPAVRVSGKGWRGLHQRAADRD